MAVDGAVESGDWISALDAQAIPLLSGGRPDVAVTPYLDRIATADFADHPWAQLVVAAALNDWRDERATSMLDGGARTFEQRQDQQGLGYAAHVRGNLALAKGDLAEAARCYQSCRAQLQRECSVDAAALANIGLAAYMRGELRQAITITEEALAIARTQTSRRYEGLACLYLAFFAVITGTFGRAESLLSIAEEAYRELADPLEQFELPLILAGQGVVAALRGDFLVADERFASAIETATDIDVQWYGAISLVLRAEFTAARNPRRSVADARNGLEQLNALNDAWWRTWAIRAQGTAAREAGDLGASAEVLERLLREELNPMERGLTLLALGETVVRTERPRDAIVPLEEARKLLDAIGATYWVARCWIALSRASPLQRSAREQARGLATDDPAYLRLLDEGPSNLRITLLGDAGVWMGDKRLIFPTRNAETAVFALALTGAGGLHEDVLIERLWAGVDADRGRARLRTVLWQVRRTLGSEAGRLERRRAAVHLRPDGVAVDLARLRERATTLLSDGANADQDELARVIEELDHPVLVGLQYESWVEAEAERNTALQEALRRLRIDR